MSLFCLCVCVCVRWLDFLDPLKAPLPPCCQASDALWYRFSSSLVIRLPPLAVLLAILSAALLSPFEQSFSGYPGASRVCSGFTSKPKLGPLALAGSRSGSAVNKTGEDAREPGLAACLRCVPKTPAGMEKEAKAEGGKKTGCENKRKQEFIRSFHHRDWPISPHLPHPLSDPTVSSLLAKSARSDVCLLPWTSVTNGVLTLHFASCLAASVGTNPARFQRRSRATFSLVRPCLLLLPAVNV